MSKLGVGETLDSSFRIYRQQFGKLIGLSALVTIPSAVLGWMLVAKSGMASSEWLSRLMTMGQSLEDLPWMQPEFLAAYGGVAIVTGILSLVVMAAISAVTLSAMRSEPISIGKCLGRGGRALPSLIVAGIAAMFLITVGCVACLVPGLIVAVCFALFVPAIVVENAGPFASLGRSARLTKGSRWAVFGVLLVTYLIVVIITMAINAIFALFSPGLFNPLAADFTVGVAIRALGSLVASFLLYPLYLIPGTVMFVKLRDQKEAAEFEYSVDRMLEGNQSDHPGNSLSD